MNSGFDFVAEKSVAPSAVSSFDKAPLPFVQETFGHPWPFGKHENFHSQKI